jgi:hypothetical protein
MLSWIVVGEKNIEAGIILAFKIRGNSERIKSKTASSEK